MEMAGGFKGGEYASEEKWTGRANFCQFYQATRNQN
jgi:hypothetical protein